MMITNTCRSERALIYALPTRRFGVDTGRSLERTSRRCRFPVPAERSEGDG